MGQRTDTALPEAHTSSSNKKKQIKGGGGEGDWLTKYIGSSDLELRKLAGANPNAKTDTREMHKNNRKDVGFSISSPCLLS